MNKVFDNLICEFFYYKYGVTWLSAKEVDINLLKGYEILRFGSDKFQFVSMTNKEVLIEVWVEGKPSFRDVVFNEASLFAGEVVWKEYYKDDKH